jgi:hypothetical protein
MCWVQPESRSSSQTSGLSLALLSATKASSESLESLVTWQSSSSASHSLSATSENQSESSSESESHMAQAPSPSESDSAAFAVLVVAFLSGESSFPSFDFGGFGHLFLKCPFSPQFQQVTCFLPLPPPFPSFPPFPFEDPAVTAKASSFSSSFPFPEPCLHARCAFWRSASSIRREINTSGSIDFDAENIRAAASWADAKFDNAKGREEIIVER